MSNRIKIEFSKAGNDYVLTYENKKLKVYKNSTLVHEAEGDRATKIWNKFFSYE